MQAQYWILGFFLKLLVEILAIYKYYLINSKLYSIQLYERGKLDSEGHSFQYTYTLKQRHSNKLVVNIIYSMKQEHFNKQVIKQLTQQEDQVTSPSVQERDHNQYEISQWRNSFLQYCICENNDRIRKIKIHIPIYILLRVGKIIEISPVFEI